MGAGGGSFAQTRVYETKGITLAGDDITPENVAAQWDQITDPDGQEILTQAFEQTGKYAKNAAQLAGVKLEK